MGAGLLAGTGRAKKRLLAADFWEVRFSAKCYWRPNRPWAVFSPGEFARRTMLLKPDFGEVGFGGGGDWNPARPGGPSLAAAQPGPARRRATGRRPVAGPAANGGTGGPCLVGGRRRNPARPTAAEPAAADRGPPGQRRNRRPVAAQLPAGPRWRRRNRARHRGPPTGGWPLRARRRNIVLAVRARLVGGGGTGPSSWAGNWAAELPAARCGPCSAAANGGTRPGPAAAQHRVAVAGPANGGTRPGPWAANRRALSRWRPTADPAGGAIRARPVGGPLRVPLATGDLPGPRCQARSQIAGKGPLCAAIFCGSGDFGGIRRRRAEPARCGPSPEPGPPGPVIALQPPGGTGGPCLVGGQRRRNRPGPWRRNIVLPLRARLVGRRNPARHRGRATGRRNFRRPVAGPRRNPARPAAEPANGNGRPVRAPVIGGGWWCGYRRRRCRRWRGNPSYPRL